jgi:ATP-dependent Lon protease
MEIIPVSRMDEVLARALIRKPEPIEWDESGVKPVPAPEAVEVDEEAAVLTAH